MKPPKRRRQWNSSLPAPSRPTLARRGRIKPKKRSATEFQRVYGSRARVAFVKNLPCVICGHGPCDNAHTENGGMGRKADYQTIVPLCCMPMDHPWSPGYPRGHHGLLHQIGVASFEKAYGVDLKKAAADTERRWQASLSQQDPKP